MATFTLKIHFQKLQKHIMFSVCKITEDIKPNS